MSILVSFIAVRNDKKREENGILDYGTNINFIDTYNKKFHKEKIEKVYFLYSDNEEQRDVKEYLRDTILEKGLIEKENINFIPWGEDDDPTDHNLIFQALAGNFPEKKKGVIRDIISKNNNGNYIIHISPGTPTMHAMWLLVTRYIDFNWTYQIFKSYKPKNTDNQIFEVDINNAFYQQVVAPQKDKSEISYFPNQSKIYEELSEQIDIYKDIPIPILIIGERGTGKTTLAKEIRKKRLSGKNKQDWPVIVCGQFDDNSMRSELFGHVKGAYTGADQDKKGILEELDEDTLFLDEIGDLSKSTQRLLIRALDEKKFSPLGTSKTIESDFNLITATNKSLKELRKIIDPDFFDRISTFIIELPTIRQNREDIGLIWDQVCEKTKKNFTTIQGDKSISVEGKNRIVFSLSDHNIFSLLGNFRDIEFIANHYISHKLYYKNEDAAVDYAIEMLLNREQVLDLKKHKSNNCFIDTFEDINFDNIFKSIDNSNSNFNLDETTKEIKRIIINKAYRYKLENKSKTAEMLGYKNHMSITKYL